MSQKIIKGGSQFIAVFMVMLVVLSPLVTSLAMGANPVPDDEEISVAGNVSVWERSVLTLEIKTVVDLSTAS